MIEKMILIRDGAPDAIRQVMKDEGLSQTALSQMCGIKRQAIQQTLSRKNIRVDTVVRILNAMDYDLAIVKVKGS